LEGIAFHAAAAVWKAFGQSQVHCRIRSACAGFVFTAHAKHIGSSMMVMLLSAFTLKEQQGVYDGSNLTSKCSGSVLGDNNPVDN